MNALKIGDIKTATADELDDIIEATEYAEHGVALGEAAKDQDLLRAAQAEIARRYGPE